MSFIPSIRNTMQRNTDELKEFLWLTMDTTHGVMKCKMCCVWPNVSDPKSPLVMGSDKFGKDPLYAHAKSTNHVACVMRNDCMNIPLKNTPIGKAVVCSHCGPETIL